MFAHTQVQKLIDSATRHKHVAEFCAAISGIFGVGLLIFGAYQTYRKGMKVSATRTLTGTPATVLAVVMLLAAVGVGVVVTLLWLGKIHF